VESVTAVVNMAEALSGIFYILVYYLFLLNTSTVTMQLNWLTLFQSMIFSLPLVAISILFKETGVTISGMIIAKLVIDGICFWNQIIMNIQWSNYIQWDRNQEVIRTMITKTMAWILFAFAMVGFYIIFRLLIVNMDIIVLLHAVLTLKPSVVISTIGKSYLGESSLIRKAENPFAFLVTREEKILSFMVSVLMISMIQPIDSTT
jgi:hypothetical protein